MKIEDSSVVNLLHLAPHSTLAAHSLQMAGYPYASAVPNVLDEHHRPILLISALAEHTRNLLADPRVSISIAAPDVANVQDGQRLTLVGDAERVVASADLQARYLRYLPEAEQYLMLDFMFFRIHPKRLRYIGGVGRMGWVDGDAFDSFSSLSLAEESVLLQEAQAIVPNDVTLLGIDAYGIDYLVDGFRKRRVLDGSSNHREELFRALSSTAWRDRD